MKTYTFLISLLALVLLTNACQKDPLSDIKDGDWNNERSIIDIKFENQVGGANIERIDESTGEVTIAINVDAVPNLSNIKIASMQLSYGAKSSIVEGEALNFENSTNSASLTITSPTGKSRNYTIYATSFTESILGTYAVDNLIVFGGTGPEYGGGAVLALNDKPWCWPADNGPAAELDNSLTFTLDGITEEGNTFGTIVNNAGDDGQYADFTYVLDPQTDVNHFYRSIPKGTGTWTRNYTTGKVIFEFNGKTVEGSFETAQTQDFGNGLSLSIPNYALAFSLNGTDDWNNIYSDYDKFVSRPRMYFILMTKQ